MAAGRGQMGHMPPALAEGALKRGGVIFATRNIQKFCDLCLGRDGREKINHVHRTMHILDVISSFSSRSSQCTKIVSGWGFSSDQLRSLQHFPRPSSWV